MVKNMIKIKDKRRKGGVCCCMERSGENGSRAVKITQK
jgi:hypothetical protein